MSCPTCISSPGIGSAAWALLQRAVAELGDREPQLAARIEASRTGTEFYHPRYAGEFDERLPRLEAMINRPEAAPRALALVLAGLLANRGYDKARVRELVTYGIDGGRFLRDDGPESLALPHAVGALVACDELDAADRWSPTYSRRPGGAARCWGSPPGRSTASGSMPAEGI